MPQQDTSEIKAKILSIIKLKGPALPAHIARETNMSILFAGAFLSELISERKLKITNMKVGSSPIYYIEGQESKLERYSKHLKSKEKEAFEILKQKGILKDTEQHPAIRVALRSIKDFAVPFKKQKEIYFRYITVPESQLKIDKSKPTVKPLLKTLSPSLIKSKILESSGKEKQTLDIFDDEGKPIQELPETKKEKPKSEFVTKILNFLNQRNIIIQEEIELKKRECSLIIIVNSQIGPIRFFLIAKDKKRISTDDLVSTIKKAKPFNLHPILISPGEPAKKTEEYLEENKDIIKFLKLE